MSYRAWKYESVTPRQKAAISLINEMMGMNFHPINKGDASITIGKFYEEAKRIRDLKVQGEITNKEAVVILIQQGRLLSSFGEEPTKKINKKNGGT